MGYVIAAGIGLAVGLSLLIWALVERGKRADAEARALKAEADATDLRQALSANKVALSTEKDALRATQAGADALRGIIEQLRIQLRTCKDPAAIKIWLDHEMKETDL